MSYAIKKFFLASLLFSSVFCSFSQDIELPSRRIFIEAGGNGGLYSINYEQDFRKILNKNLKWEVGFSVVPWGGKRVIIDFPLSLNYTIGNGKHKAEAGSGQLIIFGNKAPTGLALRGTFHFGYRYQPENKRTFLKIAYTPLYSYMYNFQWEHWFGVGVGFHFGQLNRKP